MRLLGAKTVSDLNSRMVSISIPKTIPGCMLTMSFFPPKINSRALERDIFDGESGLDGVALPLKSKI